MSCLSCPTPTTIQKRSMTGEPQGQVRLEADNSINRNNKTQPEKTVPVSHRCAPSSTSAPTTRAASVMELPMKCRKPMSANAGVPLSTSTALRVQ